MNNAKPFGAQPPGSPSHEWGIWWVGTLDPCLNRHPVAKDITKVLVVKFFSHIFVMRDTVMSFTLSGKRWPQFQGNRGI
jgi:hypothetical protein